MFLGDMPVHAVQNKMHVEFNFENSKSKELEVLFRIIGR